ncbi:MAG: nucleotide exchange factor GrpE [Xenococcaceae cyanobacterium]
MPDEPQIYYKLFIRRLLKFFGAIPKKLLNILRKRQVHPLEKEVKSGFNLSRMVEPEVRDDLREQTIIKDELKLYNLNNNQLNQLLQGIKKLLKKNVSLQQSLRKQQGEASTENEKLFLELLEVVDTLEPLLKYIEEHPDLDPKFIKRLPKSFRVIQKKLLNILSKRQVQPLEIQEGDRPNFNLCRVVECEVRDDLEDQTITKIVRRGFRLEDRILRPVEVITSKKQ